VPFGGPDMDEMLITSGADLVDDKLIKKLELDPAMLEKLAGEQPPRRHLRQCVPD